jgi:hypothetical protein
MTKRRAISRDVRNKVLVDAMHRCCLCPEHREIVDLHHVVPISEGGPNTENNLMAVCPTCHATIHRIRNRYTPEQLRMYQERWVRLCSLGLPLDVRIAQAFDYNRPPASPRIATPERRPTRWFRDNPVLFGSIAVALALAVMGIWWFWPDVAGFLTVVPATTPTLPIPGEVVLEIEGQRVTADDPCQEVYCGSSLRIEAVALDSVGVRIQPGAFSYNWTFNPSDPHNEDKLDSSNYVINYYVPCEQDSQTIAVEVFIGEQVMSVTPLCFNITEQP